MVLIRARVHPFPSRTRKLSSLLLTILGWRRPGKIGSANTKPHDESRGVLSCPEKFGSGCLRHHPVTGQLSSLLLTILGWRRPGKIGSANTKPRDESRGVLLCRKPEKVSSGCLRHHPVTGQWVGRCLLPTKGQVGALHNGRDALLRCTGGNACGDKRRPEGEPPYGAGALNRP